MELSYSSLYAWFLFEWNISVEIAMTIIRASWKEHVCCWIQWDGAGESSI